MPIFYIRDIVFHEGLLWIVV